MWGGKQAFRFGPRCAEVARGTSQRVVAGLCWGRTPEGWQHAGAPGARGDPGQEKSWGTAPRVTFRRSGPASAQRLRTPKVHTHAHTLRTRARAMHTRTRAHARSEC